MEREELRVEMALAEGSRLRRLDQRTAAAREAASGIDAFELTLKRVCGGAASGGGGGADAAPSGGDAAQQQEGPMATLGRLRAFAPAARELAEQGAGYLEAIRARRRDEQEARKEREVGCALQGHGLLGQSTQRVCWV